MVSKVIMTITSIKNKRLFKYFFYLIVGSVGVCWGLNIVFAKMGITLFTYENFVRGLWVLKQFIL